MKRSHSDTERGVIVSIAFLVALTAVGSGGFYFISHGDRSVFESLWMTLQVLTTVGDTGFERTHGEEAWSVFLMVVGVVAVFSLGVNVVRFVFDGELRALLGRRQLESKISRMHGHFIICGFGRMGKHLAETLSAKGARFVIIDTDDARLQQAEERGYLYLKGDAMSEHVLETARIRDAAGLATCLPSDADNVFITLSARDLSPGINIVARVNFEDAHSKLTRAGANHVLNPNKLAADRAMTKFMLPAVDELLEIVVHGSDLEVSKVSLENIPGAVERPLRELELPSRTSLMVVAIVHEDGRKSFNPSPDELLRAGDDMIVIGPQGAVAKLVEMYGPAPV